MLRVLRSVLTSSRPCSSKKAPLCGDDLLIPAIPESSSIDSSSSEGVLEFDHNLITHLERLSLVRFSNEEAVANLRKAVEIANKLQSINVEGVLPMHTVWEAQESPLREDCPEKPLPTIEVLSNAAKTYEDYFLTPPGNVPLEAADKLNLKLINEWDRLGKPIAPDPRNKKA